MTRLFELGCADSFSGLLFGKVEVVILGNLREDFLGSVGMLLKVFGDQRKGVVIHPVQNVEEFSLGGAAVVEEIA